MVYLNVMLKYCLSLLTSTVTVICSFMHMQCSAEVKNYTTAFYDDGISLYEWISVDDELICRS